MPTLDDVRRILHAGHSKNRPTPQITLNSLWTKHIDNRRHKYGEAFVDEAPRELTDVNTRVVAEQWSVERLSALICMRRTRLLQGDEAAPIVVVRYRGRDCLIDGGRRITKWTKEGQTTSKLVYVLDVKA